MVIVRDVGKDRRLDIAAFAGDVVGNAAAGQKRRAFGLALLDIVKHLVALGARDHRAELRFLVHRIADDDLFGASFSRDRNFA
jgi:hypothetical protein